MRAGAFRHLVTIEARSADKDEFGQREDVWRPILTTRASIETLSTQELIASAAANFVSTHKITIRYTTLLAAPGHVVDKRIVFRTRIFDVKGSANVDEANREIWMLASEGLTQG